MNYVMTAEEARAARPHLYEERTFVRDYPFALDGSAARSSVALDDEPAILETITGYVLRWREPVKATRVDGDGRSFTERNAYDRHALDEWLAEHDPAEARMCFNHVGEEIGRWTDFRADEFGLLGQAEVYDTPAGAEALREALAGGEPAMSCRCRFSLDDATVEEDDEGAFRLVRRMSLEEAGPVDEPADPGARMTYIGNVWVGRDFDPEQAVLEALSVEDLMAEIRDFVGDEFAAMLDEARFAAARQREIDEDQAGRLTRCVAAIRAARQDVDRKWSYYRDRLGTLDELREAEAVCDQHEEWLAEEVSPSDYRALLAGLPPRIPLHARLLADTRRRALPAGRW